MKNTFYKIHNLLEDDSRPDELILLVPKSHLHDCIKSMSTCGAIFSPPGWLDKNGKTIIIKNFDSEPESKKFLVMNFSEVYTESDQEALKAWSEKR